MQRGRSPASRRSLSWATGADRFSLPPVAARNLGRQNISSSTLVLGWVSTQFKTKTMGPTGNMRNCCVVG